MIRRIVAWAFFIPAMILCHPSVALATQGHGAPEGLLVHQMSHLFFAASMGVLIFWLRQRDLIKEAPWRRIQYAALFFIAWNLDAFLVHLMDEHLVLIEISRIDTFRIHIDAPPGFEWLGTVYFLAKLDHLLCAPALIFLYAGLRGLLRQSRTASATGGGKT